MNAKKRRKMVTDVSQIPESFVSEDEEREWWDSHEFSEEAIAQMQDGVAEANEWLARFRREYKRTHPAPSRRAV